jgi:hypothetical protein
MDELEKKLSEILKDIKDLKKEKETPVPVKELDTIPVKEPVSVKEPESKVKELETKVKELETVEKVEEEITIDDDDVEVEVEVNQGCQCQCKNGCVIQKEVENDIKNLKNLKISLCPIGSSCNEDFDDCCQLENKAMECQFLSNGECDFFALMLFILTIFLVFSMIRNIVKILTL